LKIIFKRVNVVEQCLHRYFVGDRELISSCDFIPEHFEGENYLYEVIRIVSGKPLFLEEHLVRLERGCIQSGIPFPGFQKLKQRIKALIQANSIDSGNIKLMLAPPFSGSKFKVALWFIPSFYPSSAIYEGGVEVALYDQSRENPTLKIFNRQYKTETSETIKKLGVYELLLTRDGQLSEGSKSNVFFVLDDDVFTPPSDQVLAGVTRQKVIRICQTNNIQCIEKPVNTHEINRFEAIFLTGTSPGVIAVNKIGKSFHFNVNHPVTVKIAKDYQLQCAMNIESFVW